jgi:hypothetical protein
MKKWNLKFRSWHFGFASLLTLGTIFFVKATTHPEQYPLSNLTAAEAQQVFRSLDTDMKGRSVCANRAHIWTHFMNRRYGYLTGKVFLFYTNRIQPPEGTQWWYHVAPYTLVDGQEMVFDAGFGFPAPLSMDRWIRSFTHQTAQCKVITDIHEYYRDRAGNYAPCYIRKVPMYYWMPLDVEDLDSGVDRDGDGYTTRNQFSESELMGACRNSKVSRAASSLGTWRRTCEDYLGF